MPSTPQQALIALQADPMSFLRKYSVRIFGDPTGSHVSSYRIEEGQASTRRGQVLGSLRRHATQRFDIKARGSALGNPPNSVWFDAHSVKMFQSDRPHDIGVYRLPAGGPNLMVTGQLSGCSFAIRENGDGTLDATHIQPSRNVPAGLLNRTLKRTGEWTEVYGRENYSAAHRASIIGVRRAGSWRIFAQKQNENDFGVAKVKQLV